MRARFWGRAQDGLGVFMRRPRSGTGFPCNTLGAAASIGWMGPYMEEAVSEIEDRSAKPPRFPYVAAAVCAACVGAATCGCRKPSAPKSETKSGAVVFVDRGTTLFQEGDYDNAISQFTKAIELKPDYAGNYLARGFCYTNKGDHDRAMADFTKAIELKPAYAAAYLARADVYREKRDYDCAITDFTRSIEYESDDPMAFVARGYTYQLRGDYEKARDDYQKALALNPEERFARKQLERLEEQQR